MGYLFSLVPGKPWSESQFGGLIALVKLAHRRLGRIQAFKVGGRLPEARYDRTMSCSPGKPAQYAASPTNRPPCLGLSSAHRTGTLFVGEQSQTQREPRSRCGVIELLPLSSLPPPHVARRSPSLVPSGLGFHFAALGQTRMDVYCSQVWAQKPPGSGRKVVLKQCSTWHRCLPRKPDRLTAES